MSCFGGIQGQDALSASAYFGEFKGPVTIPALFLSVINYRGQTESINLGRWLVINQLSIDGQLRF